MNYVIKGHNREGAIHELLICLLPDEEHRLKESLDGEGLVSSFSDGMACAEVRLSGVSERAEIKAASLNVRDVTYAVKTAAYEAICAALGLTPPWGSVTGVKPAKAMRADGEMALGADEAKKRFARRYRVSEHRANITAFAAMEAERQEKALLKDEVQLYIGIPFCPSRCSYCSFVSAAIERSGKLIPPYFDALIREAEAAGKGLENKKVGSVYVGGGTPTILDAKMLDTLLKTVEKNFDLLPGFEYTVEAGRPDTITREKLEVMSRHGVGRISVNPQTSNPRALEMALRPHSWEDIVSAFGLARECGDFCINMDLIAGLPGDDEAGLIKSVSDVLALEPDDVTLHSLAIKRGADLKFGNCGVLETAVMDECHRMIMEKGYVPYYLYKQKYSVGGLENVGFCRPGKPSKYNVVMMEELGDVVALGSGGVSKLTEDGRISRVQNPKYPLEYIERINDIVIRKENIARCIQ